MLPELFKTTGLELAEDDLNTISKLHDGFAGQRAQLSGAVRPETEPMIIPAFDRAFVEVEARDE